MQICEKKGHKFEARYDENQSKLTLERVRGCSPEEFRRLLYFNTYIHDICVRCGKTIMKGEENANQVDKTNL